MCNIRGYAEHTVPEHVFMLLLALRRNLLAWRASLKAGAWQGARQFCLFEHEMHDLFGSTLGLIGYGSVGQGVEKLARAFGMDVLIAERKGADTVRSGRTAFDAVLARADQISLHTPLTDDTRGLIGAREFGLMKRSAVLINTAIAVAEDPNRMARAFRMAVEAGRAAYEIGLGPSADTASATSPPTGFLDAKG